MPVKSILAMTLLAAVLVLPGCARTTPESAALAPSADASFAALQARGEVAMGVDQYASAHRFDALADGGRIELQMNSADPAAILEIREHLAAIARAFQAGDFSTPAFVHMQEVPGTAVMAARRDLIQYRFQALPRGGEVRITTQDPEALHAIHAFMAFQREDHRAGGEEHPHPGGMGADMDHAAHMGGMDHASHMGGMGGGAMGAMEHPVHDAAFKADMQLVHELLAGHEAIERTVTKLPDGVRSVTESASPLLASIIKEHVASMMERLASGEVFNISSSTIPVIFANRDRIQTRIEETERGVIFTQTTDVPELVGVLQAHAEEVDELVREGMAAMMRNMMQRGAAPGGAPGGPRP